LLKSLVGSFSFELFSHAKLYEPRCLLSICDGNLVTPKMIPRYAPRGMVYAMGSMITKVHKSRCQQYSKASLNG
jgi:hypothetical protein